MSDKIDNIEKRIYNNQPSHLPSVTIPYAQYNYGRATRNDPYKLMGTMPNQYYENLELYTTIQTKDNPNVIDYRDGLLTGVGSYFTADKVLTHTLKSGPNPETEKRWMQNKFAIYFLDGATEPGRTIYSSVGGDNFRSSTIQNALGTGHGFDDTPNHNRINYYNLGEYNKDPGFEMKDDFPMHTWYSAKAFSVGTWNAKAYDYSLGGMHTYDYFNARYDETCDYDPEYGLSTGDGAWLPYGIDFPGTGTDGQEHPDYESWWDYCHWLKPEGGGDPTHMTDCCTPYSLTTTQTHLTGADGVRRYQNARVDNFHLPDMVKKPYHDGYHIDEVGPTVASTEHFTLTLGGTYTEYDADRYFMLMSRTAGDEREKIPGPEGEIDERDRGYTRLFMDKTKLYGMWKRGWGETKSWEQTTSRAAGFAVGGSRHDGDQSTTRDTHGDGIGYKKKRGKNKGEARFDNEKEVIWGASQIKGSITVPQYDINSVMKPINEGGLNANWVKQYTDGADGSDGYSIDEIRSGWHCLNAIDNETGARAGLSPLYGIDFTGFPERYYGEENTDGSLKDGETYFKAHLIPGQTNSFGDINHDFRPISFVSSSFDVDLQSYYEGPNENDQILRIQSGAPTTAHVSFKLAKSLTNSIPEFIDFESDTNYNEYDYWFYIVNWDWKDGDAGGGSCEDENSPINCVDDITQEFPTSGYELAGLQSEGEDKYILNKINKTEVELEDEDYPYPHTATHTYLEPGIKIVKALIFTTINNQWEADDAGYQPYLDFYQAVTWKMATMRIYLSDDGAGILSDFDDIGGDEYTYLPFPEVTNLQEYYLHECTDEDVSSGFSNCMTSDTGDDDGDGIANNVISVDIHGRTPNDIPYQSSHIVISGFSEDSTYITSLEKIKKMNPFGRSEMDEKMVFNKSYAVSPVGRLNELGRWFGQSDISQVRYLNKSVIDNGTDFGLQLDMAGLLGIQDNLTDSANAFYPHHNIDYWNGETNSFPLESSVGDIFINEYDQLSEFCLFELNPDSIDGKSLRDTTGSGNKGILVGDYAIKKEEVGEETVRDSYVKIAKIENLPGAF